MLEPPYPGLTRVCLKEDIDLYGWAIGDHTYGRPNVMEKGRAHLEIGRFTSMAAATIVLGNHDTRNVSTYPFDALRAWWPGMDDSACHIAWPVRIGSDVWICESSIVLPGTTISHGAVIGAGAAVSGTIPPYAVVSGNPGTVVKYRFEPKQIGRLLSCAWWDLPDRQINAMLPLLASHDVDAFLARVEELRDAR